MSPFSFIATFMFFVAACGIAQAQSAADSTNRVLESSRPDSLSPRIAECHVGFDNRYKVGFWTPVRVDVVNAAALSEPQIEVQVIDSDGVQTTVSARLDTSESADATATLMTKIGRTTAPIRVSLVDDGKVLDDLELDPSASSQGMPVLDALSATSELVLSFGGPGGLSEAIADRDSAGNEFSRRVVEVEDVAALPQEWVGYEAVDLFVLSASDLELCQALASDAPRLAALRRWVELGGRLAITSGGEQAEQLFAKGQPLAALIPGTLGETVRLTEATPLEHFAEAPEPIAARRGSRIELSVPRLDDVRGNIAVYAGGQPTDLPIVVRAPLGLGEVTFAGLDLASPPLAEWPGRDALWQALLRPYIAEDSSEDGPRTIGTLGYDDLSGALRQQLGRAFPSVTTVTFPIVALFVIVYLILLGPAHYWLVHHFGGRPALAWVVFPLLVLVASVSAFWVGERSRGATPRVNQVELIDFDMTTRKARGTNWAALYSPEVRQFDLSLRVNGPEGAEFASLEKLVSWWGLSGVGVGGMHGGSLSLAATDVGYRFSPELDTMWGVPMLTSSTKSIMGRWNAEVNEIVHSELTDDDGLVIGAVTNETGETLSDARLLYGTWAYRLGDLQAGERIDVGEHLSPITVNTLITRRASTNSARGGNGERASFFVDRASTEELLMVMMFYRAAGGETFARLPNRYQSYCDLSRLLDLGRAILVADEESSGSQLIDPTSGEPIEGAAVDDRRVGRVVYRFVLPVETE